VEDLKHYPISVAEVVRARSIVRDWLKPTQLTYYEGLSRCIGAEVYVKHENHNPTGTFKIRGGLNLMWHLRRGGVQGVVTYSTGNHGLSVATAAKWFGLHAVIVVPVNANPVKKRAIRECGAELVEAGATFDECAQSVERLVRERGLYYAHPANEPLLIDGVGTGFLEVIEDLPDLDVMIVPLGAGSEAAAAITTLRAFRPKVQIIAVQAQNSRAAHESWKTKTIRQASNTSFAGGVATGMAYELPFSIYSQGLDDFVLLSEDELYDAMGAACHYTHNLAEGAGAASIGAAYKIRQQLQGRKVALQLSGCNASPAELLEANRRDAFQHGYE